MQVDPIIAGAAMTAILGLQGWMLLKISVMSEQVAALTAQFNMHLTQSK